MKNWKYIWKIAKTINKRHISIWGENIGFFSEPNFLGIYNNQNASNYSQ